MRDHLQLYPLQGSMSFLDSHISGRTTAATSKGSTDRPVYCWHCNTTWVDIEPKIPGS
jgi:hypothetical protein